MRRDDHPGPAQVPQLADRVDKMLAAGRITPEEANRVRRAMESGDVEAVVAQIRLRHARGWLQGVVADGRMTPAEADGILAGLERGEQPRTLLSRKRR